MLDNMRIGKKLYLLVGFLAVMAIAIGSVGVKGISSSNEGLGRVYNDNMVPTIMLAEIDDALMDSVKHMLLSSFHDPRLSESELHEKDHPITRHTDNISKRMARLNGTWKKFKELGSRSEEEKKLIAAIDANMDKFNEEAVKKGMALIEARRFRDANEHVVWSVNPIMKQIEESMTQLSDIQVNKGKSEFETAQRNYNRIRVLLLVSLLVAIGLTIAASAWIIRSITGPVRQITDTAALMSQGNLSTSIDIRRKDEIGALADSFREMTAYLQGIATSASEIAEGDLRRDVTPKSDKDVLGMAFSRMLNGLRSIVAEVRSGANQMSSAATQIASTTEQSSRNNEASATAVEETTSTMHEMAANIQNVARSTRGQASSVAETSSSIEQMAASTQRIAGTAQQLTELSMRAKQAVNLGIEAVGLSNKGTDDISRSIMRSADTIAALGSRAEDIGKIVDVIDDIAEQTNLLALNAAIEAARAGEQGLGFAVVAEEVRKLAERSAKSTKEISDLIVGIQKEAQEAVKLMDRSTQIVEKGVEMSRQVSGSLRDIEGNVSEVDKYAREISAATHEQGSGSTQIARAAENLREVTQEVTSATDEQASAAEQIVRTMEKMRSMIQQNASASIELASSAEQLRVNSEKFTELVGMFRLSSSGGTGIDKDKTNGGNKITHGFFAEVS